MEWAASELLDPQGRQLAAAVQWWPLAGLNDDWPDPWPVAVLGSGPPLLLLHGFDSSFLEFRRLAPLLAQRHQLFIPDLFGFGFTPRPPEANYGPGAVLAHLEALVAGIQQRLGSGPIDLIGASMGGAVALELARRKPHQVEALLLLDPAGLGGVPRPLPLPLAALGVRFLSLPWVRRGLCRSAFADPDGSVGAPELEIASLHLNCPGWANSLAAFACSGGFAGCGEPLPSQPIRVLWGDQDRVLGPGLRRQADALLGERIIPVPRCGHLPHLDQPRLVRDQLIALQSHGPSP